MDTEDFIPEYLDKEPAALMGLSLSELIVLMFQGFLGGFVTLSIIAIFLLQNALFVVLAFVLSIGIGVFYTKVRGQKLRDESKGKPDFYNKHSMSITMEKITHKLGMEQSSTLHRYLIPDGLWGR